MKAGSKVMFRDAISSDLDMRDLHATRTALCGQKSDQFEYASDTLYHSYLDGSPGSYFWDFAGADFQWVYPTYDTGFVSHAEQPAGSLSVSPEMLYVDDWPEMTHTSVPESDNTHEFRVWTNRTTPSIAASGDRERGR